MLEALDISYEVGGNRLVLEVSIKAPPGRLLAIIGPNGAGKSTLLRILAGELKPTNGSVQLDGIDVSAMKPYNLAARRAVVPQATHLGFPFTAGEVVALGQSVPGFSRTTDDTARDAMERVGILDIANRSYQALSGGERQRVHFARALCQLTSSPSVEAPVLLLDEATSNLDLAHQLQVLSEARQRAASGAIVIAVLHDWNLAAQFSDDVLLLSDGRIAAVGPPEHVFADELLSAVFKCEVRCNKVPMDSVPYVLPQLCSRSTAPRDNQ